MNMVCECTTKHVIMVGVIAAIDLSSLSKLDLLRRIEHAAGDDMFFVLVVILGRLLVCLV